MMDSAIRCQGCSRYRTDVEAYVLGRMPADSRPPAFVRVADGWVAQLCPTCAERLLSVPFGSIHDHGRR